MAEITEKVENNNDARRRILNIAVSTVLLETGFSTADKMSLETLTEMLQACKFMLLLMILIIYLGCYYYLPYH